MKDQEKEETYLDNHKSDISMEELLRIDKLPFEKPIAKRQADMKRETWIKNVLKIYPEKTRKETEELHDKIFKDQLKEV